MSGQRNRPRRQVTLSPEVDAYLGQDHINASQLVDAAIRDKVTERGLQQAARQAGVGEYSDEDNDDDDQE